MYEIGHRQGLPPTCFPANFDQSDLQEITTLTDSWARFLNTRTNEIVDCAVFAKQAQGITLFQCMPKCPHVFDKWIDIVEDGRVCGGTMTCSLCGTTALQESLWG